MRLIKTLAAGVAASLLFAMPAMAQGTGGAATPAAAPSGSPKAGATTVKKSAAAEPASSAAPAAGAPVATPPVAGAREPLRPALQSPRALRALRRA
ncbi:MAG: hypothetical protein ABI134_12245, partial [Byssovorax sp.]